MGMRIDRVGEAVKEVVADQLVRLTDPGFGFVSITGVVVSPDLRIADVYFSILDTTADGVDTARAFERARPRLQKAIGRDLNLKRTPVLRFHLDEGIRAGERIDTILRGVADDPEV